MSETRKPAPWGVGADHELMEAQQREALASVYSGAPLQPGATQPERDGVSHETEKPVRARRIGATCFDTGTTPMQQTYTHSELTTLLERMARLVVEKAAKAVCPLCAIGHKPLKGMRFWWHDEDDCEAGDIWDLDSLETMQQLREAVERP